MLKLTKFKAEDQNQKKMNTIIGLILDKLK